MKYKIYSDGAARGNPGPAGAGYVVYDETGVQVYSETIPLGRTTNNIAEYTAILEAAKYIKSLNPVKVDFMLDSELVVRQLSGQYKVRANHLLPLYHELKSILAGLNCNCLHIPREQNKAADKLANKGADMSAAESK
ncbi:MAG: ribonuclease HI family protein [Deferribacteraceae bacterium]|nr:ribonuclease HI family protein [Deferribacteraceae bacterium]